MQKITYKFTIPGELPTLNEIIAASKKGRGGYQPYAEMKRENDLQVALSARSVKRSFEKIDLKITWYCKNKRKDKDNIMAGTKFILDGIVQAGLIPNDGWGQVGTISHEFKIGKLPRVEVRLQESEEE